MRAALLIFCCNTNDKVDDQVKYVVELARALANTKGIHRVDLLTRQISSSEVDSSYGEPTEMLSCPSDATGSCGAYIIRIPCGPRDKYSFIIC